MGKIEYKASKNMPVFRKIAVGSWTKLGDPSVYATLEFDVSHCLKFIQKQQELYPDLKISLLSFFARAMALCLKKRPEINAVQRFRKPYLRKNIDIFFQLNIPGKNNDPVERAILTGICLRQVDKKNIVDIAREIKERSELAKSGKFDELGDSQSVLAKIPWFLMKYVLNIAAFLNYDLNLDIRFLGMPKDAFGSLMITNIGSLGLDNAYVPLVPYTRVPMLLSMGMVQDRAWVVDGQIQIRPILRIGVTFDHRFIDGVHAADMYKLLQQIFFEPEKYMLDTNL